MGLAAADQTERLVIHGFILQRGYPETSIQPMVLELKAGIPVAICAGLQVNNSVLYNDCRPIGIIKGSYTVSSMPGGPYLHHVHRPHAHVTVHRHRYTAIIIHVFHRTCMSHLYCTAVKIPMNNTCTCPAHDLIVAFHGIFYYVIKRRLTAHTAKPLHRLLSRKQSLSRSICTRWLFQCRFVCWYVRDFM